MAKRFLLTTIVAAVATRRPDLDEEQRNELADMLFNAPENDKDTEECRRLMREAPRVVPVPAAPPPPPLPAITAQALVAYFGLHVTSHGGGCCGVQHIRGFSRLNYLRESGRAFDVSDESVSNALLTFIRQKVERAYHRTTMFNENNPRGGILVEAILTDPQVASGWGAVMALAGFRLVTRYQNDNSGNYCNVFHYLTPGATNEMPEAE